MKKEQKQKLIKAIKRSKKWWKKQTDMDSFAFGTGTMDGKEYMLSRDFIKKVITK